MQLRTNLTKRWLTRQALAIAFAGLGEVGVQICTRGKGMGRRHACGFASRKCRYQILGVTRACGDLDARASVWLKFPSEIFPAPEDGYVRCTVEEPTIQRRDVQRSARRHLYRRHHAQSPARPLHRYNCEFWIDTSMTLGAHRACGTSAANCHRVKPWTTQWQGIFS